MVLNDDDFDSDECSDDGESRCDVVDLPSPTHLLDIIYRADTEKEQFEKRCVCVCVLQFDTKSVGGRGRWASVRFWPDMKSGCGGRGGGGSALLSLAEEGEEPYMKVGIATPNPLPPPSLCTCAYIV